jgi:hypothetical protein
MEKKADQEWKLEKIVLEFQNWGEHKGKYCGSIKFTNGESEMFQFNVNPNMAQPYIDLMANDIVVAASGLADRLMESLGLKKE